MIDTHSHLNDPQFQDDLPEVIHRALAAGINKIVVCGYDLESSKRAVDIAECNEHVFATVGIHPHDSKTISPDTIKELAKMAQLPKVVAIGETGLDFYRDLSPRSVQERSFASHIKLAIETGLPIIVHNRNASEAILRIIDHHKDTVSGVFHCFSGDMEFAKCVVDKGFYIGIAGLITFGSRKPGPLSPTKQVNPENSLWQVVRSVPLAHLLLETDCPYLAPVPHRGKRNEPAYLVHIAEKLAMVLGVTMQDVDYITSQNAERLFPRIRTNQNK
ncbi:MAG: TatD family hydrolase [Armatimonadota bacterium]